ncbi:FAD-dependent oxidoreductase [Nisaea acidiphila]|uniref:FAD-dependent oxidoreductase n=1 Tax=Nisaea acidiphila TaxID=1862145 RepID=A0A9J7AYX8_9PROT|nr:FAD-dependent oxidoreductase [Nisaea acidiphila]UUX51994.1 FAD-dependent oxidoreductase [Nisaea acidiphila]
MRTDTPLQPTEEKLIETDICVIGGGSGGLSVAAGAVQMGTSVVLFERGRMGGDCLNYGCVPSKALLAAGHAAAAARKADRFGISLPEPDVDFARVHAHVRDVIAGIEPHDSVERFEKLGVKVIQAAATFTDTRTVTGGGYRVRARRFVIATGSSAAIPPVEGLKDTPYLTNETIFDLTERPAHLLIIGGGPIGCELAEAHRNLGSEVTLVEAAGLLGNEDPEAAALIRAHLEKIGVTVLDGALVRQASGSGGGVTLSVETGGAIQRIEGSHLLVAAGRRANTDGLGLEAAGIETSRTGIEVDAGLKTSNRRVYAIGDVAGGLQFTHVAGYHASVVIRSALFRLPAKADLSAVPRVTYTDPELAQVGLLEEEARAKHGEKLRVLRWTYQENDRARAERATEGFIKVIALKNGRVLGATIVGRNAGELIQSWGLAIGQKIKIGAIASSIVAYPTLAEIGKRAAGSFFTETLFSPRMRKIVRFLAAFG